MRTGRSLTVCWSLLPGGVSAPRGVWSRGGGWCLLPGGCLLQGEGVSASRGCLLPGGVSAQGVSAPGGVCSGGMSAPGGVCSWGVGVYPSMHWGRHPNLWTESHTPVKTLPWPNFVAAGNNYAVIKLRNYLTHCLNYDDATNVTTGRYTTVVT